MSKPILKFGTCLLMTGILFISCKKEKSCEGCKDGNKPPKSNAGPDRIITLPTDSVLLDGSASSDPDGTISSFQWRKISGPASFTIVTAPAARTNVKQLVRGVYQFELNVNDNGGLSAKDTVQVIVNDPSQPNHPPVANAGADQTITLPLNSVTIDGSGSTDPDNNITSYIWSKISGPSSFNIGNASAVQTQITNLVQGSYQFELKVTDAGGLFSKDTVLVTSSTSSPCAQLISVGSLSIHRDFVCAASTGNKILFAGGATQTSPSVIESSRVDIYDIPSNSWSTAELSMPRSALVSTTLGNKIFFTDGFYNGSSRVDIYDASTNTWSTSDLSTGRAGLASASAGNKVVFAGGYVPFGNRIDIYDAASNNWSTATLNEPRADISAASMGNKIYFSGGLNNLSVSNNVDVYDGVTNSWSTINMTEPRWFHATIGADNKIFWAGGGSSFDANGNVIANNSVEIYDVNTGTRTTSQLSQSPYFAGIINNKIIFLPSFAGISFAISIYDISSQAWSVVNISCTEWIHCGWRKAIVASGNKIYMVGGEYGSPLPNRIWKLECL